MRVKYLKVGLRVSKFYLWLALAAVPQLVDQLTNDPEFEGSNPAASGQPGNTKGGSITVLLTSCLTGLESVYDSNKIMLQGALSQVFRVKNVKDIVPKLNYCMKKSMVQLDSYAKTGEDIWQVTILLRHSQNLLR
jgi:hypothetical protein